MPVLVPILVHGSKLKAVMVAPQRISNHGGESAEMSIAPVVGNKLPWNVVVSGE